jgi:putative DNA primase/helicase
VGEPVRRLRSIDGGKSKKKARDPAQPVVSREVQTFACSDTGNAERLINKFGERLRYVPDWGEYIVHVGTHWKRDIRDIQVSRLIKASIKEIEAEGEYGDISDKKALKKWRQKSESCGSRMAVLKLAASEEGVAVEVDDLDANRWVLNAANGTLDLNTGTFSPHDPKDLITKVLKVAYNKNAKAPRWKKFLAEVLPDPVVRSFVQRYLGYCLTGIVTERVFVIFLGHGSNGKTVLVNAIQAVLGSYATVAASTLLTSRDKDQHPTEIAALQGVRLAITSETKKGASFDEEKVKRLTGGDILTCRRMGENFWEFAPTHKLLLLLNHKPRVRDATLSFWDRVAIVPFDVRFVGKKVNRQLTEVLKEEREGILTWLVEGCRQWREQGLEPPAVVMAATKEYKDEEDIAGRFLDECFVVDKIKFMYTSDIIERNKTWASANNLYPISTKDLAEKLKMEPFSCTPVKRDGLMGWKGLRLKKKGE